MMIIDEITSAHRVNDLPAAAAARLQALMVASLDTVFPAAAVTVVKDGQVVLNEAWGWIDPDTRLVPVMTGTLFDLASVTKLFTVTAFLSLAGEHGLSLDAPIITVLPEFGCSGPRPVDGGIDPHSKEPLPVTDDMRHKRVDPARVTFRHLLTHTSGLAAWRDVYNAAGPAPAPPDNLEPLSRQERWSRALAALWNYPFVDEPGSGVRYSDLGLMLLGEAVSRLYGASGQLDKAIAARVIEPLKLETVLFNPAQSGISCERIAPTEDDPLWRKRRVWGEVHDENACGVGGVAGHAGLFATARDVAALGQGWLVEDARLGIASEWLRAAKQEQANGERRGLGWALKSAQGSSAGELFSMDSYGHTGFTGTSLWIDPARALVVAALTNSVYPGRLKPGTFEFRRDLHTLLAAGL